MSVYIKLPLIRYCELGVGDIGIYCHDISWQKYRGITIYHDILFFLSLRPIIQ